jgi:hypothetical protein
MKLGKNSSDNCQLLSEAYGAEAMEKSSVLKWQWKMRKEVIIQDLKEPKKMFESVESGAFQTVKQHYLLSPWRRITFEKLTVTQLVEKYPALLWNRKVHYRVHTSPPLDPILSQLNPVRPIDSYLPKVHLNVILPPTPRSFQWSLPFGPTNQNPVNTSPLPHACHMSLPPHPP